MNTDDALRSLLLEIIRVGLRRIRTFAHNRDSTACHREADHIHNLPELVTTLNLDQLRYYLDVERGQFVRDDPDAPLEFMPLWEEMDSLLRKRSGGWSRWWRKR